MTGGKSRMEYAKEETKKLNIMKLITISCLLFIFIVVSSYLGSNYYRPFHVVVETFSAFIAFSILVMAVNTYELSNNIPFLFLGVAWGFAAGFNIIHIIASNGVGFFDGDTTNLAMILSTLQRFISAISVLIFCRMFYKPSKLIRPFTIVLVFSIVSILLLAWVFLWRSFPCYYIPGYGVTPFKTASEYIISAITVISVVFLFKGKKYIEPRVFLLLQVYFYTAIAINILLTFYIVQQEITNVLAHVLKLISFYCIYRAIVKVGLKTPYKLMFNELNWKKKSLEIKDFELKQAVKELQKESEQRKHIEELFIKNEASYKLLIENSKDAIIIYNGEKLVFANEGAACIFGVDKPEMLLEETAAELIEMNKQKILEAVFPKNQEKETIDLIYETQVISTDNRIIPVEINNAYITYHNKPAVLSLIRDISSHKQVEKMKKDVEEDRKLLNETLEFNRLITEFFSNISHELRTPLNVILGALQVLVLEKYKEPSEEVVEKRDRYIKIMKQNCYRLLKLINNLIDITRIDSGYVKPRLQNYDIVSAVEDITLSVAEYVENKGIELIFDTDVEEKIIACDPDKIIVEVSDLEDNIQVSVKDTGIGIPEDKLEIIFERFRQADNSLSRNHEGSGIGLSLVKALVEMHGGTIRVKSLLGEGSEFIINLPARSIDNAEVVKNNVIYEDDNEKISIEFSDI